MKHQALTATLLAWACSAALSFAAEPVNLVPNGNFEPGGAVAPEQGWELSPPAWQKQKGFTAEFAHVSGTPGGPFVNSWLQLTSSASTGTATATRLVALPAGTKQVRIVAKFRVDKIEVAAEPKWAGAFIGGAVLDAEKKKLGSMPNPAGLKKPTEGWVKVDYVMKLPAGAAFLQIVPGLYHASGDFAVDDLELHAL